MTDDCLSFHPADDVPGSGALDHGLFSFLQAETQVGSAARYELVINIYCQVASQILHLASLSHRNCL